MNEGENDQLCMTDWMLCDQFEELSSLNSISISDGVEKIIKNTVDGVLAKNR